MWYEPVFLACNYGVLPAWLLLVFAPRWRWTERLVHAGLVPLLFGAAYATILLTVADGSPDGSFLTLDGVEAIFTSRQATAAAWIHYLIFDLFCGAWQVRDARRLGIPHLAVVPCLVLTLMLGPIGLALYVVLRGVLRKRWSFVETEGEAAVT